MLDLLVVKLFMQKSYAISQTIILLKKKKFFKKFKTKYIFLIKLFYKKYTSWVLNYVVLLQQTKIKFTHKYTNLNRGNTCQ